MARMTWQELKIYLDSMDEKQLDSFIYVYDASTGESIDCDVVELTDDNQTWVPHIGINLSDLE